MNVSNGCVGKAVHTTAFGVQCAGLRRASRDLAGPIGAGEVLGGPRCYAAHCLCR